MSLVQAKCTNCGGILEVDNAKDAAICKYCGTPFIVEKAINNYHITNSITTETVNVYCDSATDFVIHGGVLESYNGNSLDVIIPDSVIKIGQKAFVGKNWSGLAIQTVTFPSTLTEICSSAFSYCSELKKIDIPTSVKKIGSSAFSDCKSVEEIIIPRMTVIYNDSFKGTPNGPVWSTWQNENYTAPSSMPYWEYLFRVKRVCPECNGTIIYRKKLFSYWYECSDCGKKYDHYRSINA